MLDALFDVLLMHLAVGVRNTPQVFIVIRAFEAIAVRIIWELHACIWNVHAELFIHAAWNDMAVSAETDAPVSQPLAADILLFLVADDIILLIVFRER